MPFSYHRTVAFLSPPTYRIDVWGYCDRQKQLGAISLVDQMLDLTRSTIRW
jgi:hypothetical protein